MEKFDVKGEQIKMRSWLLLILVSLIGYSASFLLFPKVMPAARWNHNVDYNAAIAIAKRAARDFGVNDVSWETPGSGLNQANVSAEYSRRRESYLATEPNGIGHNYFTPLDVTVKLIDFKSQRKVTATINSNGKLLEFDTSIREPKKEMGSGEQVESNKVSDADLQLAESTVKNLWGDNVLASARLSESSVTRKGTRFVWKTEGSRMKLLTKALIRDGKIKQVSLEPEFTSQFDAEFNSQRSTLTKVLSNAEGVVIWPPVFLIAIFYFIGVALNRIQHKQALIFLAVTFVLITAYNWFQGVTVGVDEGSSAGGNYWVVKLFSWFFFLLGMLFIAGSLYFVWAAGQSLAIRLPNRRTISLELILKGKLLTKPVARGVAIGLLSGGIVVAIPLLLSASKLFNGMQLDSSDLEDTMVSPFPTLALVLNGLEYLGLVLFGFMAPLVLVYVKWPVRAKLLVFLVVSIGLLGSVSVYLSAPGLIAAALLVSLALTITYFRGDLLAVIISLGASQAAFGAAALMAQPLTSLKLAAWKVIALIATGVIVSLIGVWKFREASEEETAVPLQLLETRDERERLKAEFNVAQRAQQQMLPDAPPQIPGLEIAAICLPSKEVGGDLYDFLPLPDGKLGIVVADVSGKGVPASLYMTLTKGLLESVSETTSDPGEILREVNRHLYEVCRRKMFVTLFLGVIDPVTKRLMYARAGHNPTVFRRPFGETKLLSAGGIGLGLNRGKIFDQTLKVETLQLAANDKLFFYSDGITEAMNPKNEEYGEERLMDLAERLDEVGANEARDVVLDDVKQFLASNQPQDDQTLVVVKIV
ncbi:MAG TPA: PP2C family protein-serine/threonine phosphatase [Blastocatellia bacterium]|nr:PP2C family protein-serine/threonine phosphatase [Blastocatellia bacterium]